MWRSLASNMLTFLVVGLFLLGGVVLWGRNAYVAQGPLEQAICLRVERGATLSGVSRDLVAQQAIRNGTVFRLGADYTGKAEQLKAGSFLVTPGASMEQIVAQVTAGGASTCGTEILYRIGVTRNEVQVRELDPAVNAYQAVAEFDPAETAAPAEYTAKAGQADTRFRVSMAEGTTSWQVVEALKAFDILTGEIAAVPAEGTLAPDSYEITPGTDRAAILALMQSRQQDRIAAAWENRQEGLPITSPEEMVILASIIEKETGIAEERGTVASVFVNRLGRGMRLQTDPTVIYGVTRGKGVLGRGLRQSELRAATPWNTYVIDGLPPTPIANPGLASLQAAVAPEATEFVFFVADGTGGHVFARTLAEHNRNVAEWRKIEAAKEKAGN